MLKASALDSVAYFYGNVLGRHVRGDTSGSLMGLDLNDLAHLPQDIEAQFAALEAQLRSKQADAEASPAEGEAWEQSAQTMAAD